MDEWTSTIDDMQNYQYFNASVRAFFLLINLYNPSQDKFVTTEMLIEFSNTGLVSPEHLNVRTFEADVFDSSKDKGIRTTEFFRLFCTIYIGY